jgi:ABC-2 type transport system ATP-binding protein
MISTADTHAAPSRDTVPLALTQVTASYGKRVVLRDISFAVSTGECFGLIGLNGIGKTTLIRSILGLKTTEGAVSLFGASNRNAESRRHLIYLPERFQPSPQLYGWEYLSILTAYFGQAVDRDHARRIAAGLDLDPAALDHKVRTYSKGMGQKLGLVGTFLVRAPLMILDEPMSGLDPRARALLKDRLTEARGEGRTIFFSSHILADIQEICDRIGVIHAGRMIFLGTPDEFLSRYRASSLERAFLAALDETERAAA